MTFEGSGTLDGLRLGYAVNLLRVSSGTLDVINTTFGAHDDGNCL